MLVHVVLYGLCECCAPIWYPIYGRYKDKECRYKIGALKEVAGGCIFEWRHPLSLSYCGHFSVEVRRASKFQFLVSDIVLNPTTISHQTELHLRLKLIINVYLWLGDTFSTLRTECNNYTVK